jgi:hypothetical protein
MQIVNPFFTKNDPEGACNALIKEATSHWEEVKNKKIIENF